jgi:hypothetical protein
MDDAMAGYSLASASVYSLASDYFGGKILAPDDA